MSNWPDLGPVRLRDLLPSRACLAGGRSRGLRPLCSRRCVRPGRSAAQLRWSMTSLVGLASRGAGRRSWIWWSTRVAAGDVDGVGAVRARRALCCTWPPSWYGDVFPGGAWWVDMAASRLRATCSPSMLRAVTVGASPPPRQRRHRRAGAAALGRSSAGRWSSWTTAEHLVEATAACRRTLVRGESCPDVTRARHQSRTARRGRRVIWRVPSLGPPRRADTPSLCS